MHDPSITVGRRCAEIGDAVSGVSGVAEPQFTLSARSGDRDGVAVGVYQFVRPVDAGSPSDHSTKNESFAEL
jgi:hypothetical protein